jgi:hypothetical protein
VCTTVLASACTVDGRRRATEEGTAPFETVLVSVRSSDLPQGETEVIADGRGDLVAVWMDGSPANQARLTLRSARSRDGGRTFAPDEPVAEDLRLVDPTLAVDARGDVVLGALRKNSRFGWTDVDVVAFRDTGTGWSTPVVLNAEGVFNDRPWLGHRSDGQLIVTFGRRMPLPDGNFDRPVFIAEVPEAGGPAAGPPKRLVNPAPLRTPGTAGGSARTVVFDGNRVVMGYQDIPADNADRAGAGTYSAPAHALVSEDGGATFRRRLPITTQDSTVADGGEAEGAGPDSFLQPFPRLGAGGHSVVAVWIGPEGRTGHAVYCAVLGPGATAFEPPVAVTSAEPGALTLPTVAVDSGGRAHVFWLERGQGSLWTLRYSGSDHGCSQFSTPRAASHLRFPLRRWAGDFMGATTRGADVVVAWPVAGGSDAGVHVTVGRRLATD